MRRWRAGGRAGAARAGHPWRSSERVRGAGRARPCTPTEIHPSAAGNCAHVTLSWRLQGARAHPHSDCALQGACAHPRTKCALQGACAYPHTDCACTAPAYNHTLTALCKVPAYIHTLMSAKRPCATATHWLHTSCVGMCVIVSTLSPQHFPCRPRRSTRCIVSSLSHPVTLCFAPR